MYVGKTLRSGPKPLEELSRYFHTAGYSVYMPYDDDVQNDSAQIKARDLEELKSSVGTALEGKKSLDEITEDFLSKQPSQWKFRQIVRSNVKKVYGELSKGLLMSAE